MDQYGVKKDIFICAKPCLMTNGVPQLDKDSSNSQTIDLLLIKKKNECREPLCITPVEFVVSHFYDLITIDFCMAFTKAYIQEKIRKA